MKIKEIVKSIRIAIDDTNSVRFTDYTVLDVVNSVFNVFANFLIRQNSNILTKEITLDTSSGSAELPSNLVTITSVKSDDIELQSSNKLSGTTYKIVGNSIKTKCSSLDIEYTSCFTESFTMDDDVPFPLFLNEYLKKYIVIALTTNSSAGTGTALALSESDITDMIELLSNREYSYIEREMPFIV